MSNELAQLMDDFYAYFLDLYHERKSAGSGAGGGGVDDTQAGPPSASTAVPGLPFIAFEGIGTAITPSMFKLDSGDFFQPLVAEQFSLLANVVPVLSGCAIVAPGLLTVDGYYGTLLEQAQALPTSNVDAFNSIKHDAREAFDNASLEPRVAGHTTYRPALPTPPDWPLPSGNGAWVSHTLSRQAQTATVTQAPTPVTVRPAPTAMPISMPVWGLRIAPPALSSAVTSLSAAHDAVPRRTFVAPPPPPVSGAHPPAMQLAVNQMMLARIALLAHPAPAPLHAFATGVVIPAPARPAGLSPVQGVRVAPPAPPGGAGVLVRPPPGVVHVTPPPHSPPSAASVRPDTLALHLQELSQRATQQSVASQGLTLSFDYCLVTAGRPWMSPFLAWRTWFVPGMRAGEIASGTGTGTGVLEAIPAAAIVVRKLTIEAQWSDQNAAALGSAVTLGPFSLVGRSVTQGSDKNSSTLACDGMQIVAWVMQPLPKLPPCDDPALGAAAAAVPSAATLAVATASAPDTAAAPVAPSPAPAPAAAPAVAAAPATTTVPL